MGATWLDALHQRIPFGFGEDQGGALVRQRDVMVLVLNGLAADGVDIRAAVDRALGAPRARTALRVVESPRFTLEVR